MAIIKNSNFCDKHTHRQTDIATSWPTRPSGPSWWKYARAIGFWTFIPEDKICIRFILFQLLNCNRILRTELLQNFAHCTLHLHPHLYLHLHLYTLDYTMNTVQCRSYTYTTCCSFITLHYVPIIQQLWVQYSNYSLLAGIFYTFT